MKPEDVDELIEFTDRTVSTLTQALGLSDLYLAVARARTRAWVRAHPETTLQLLIQLRGELEDYLA